MAKKTYSILRDFNSDAEPAMKGHELIVHDAIKAAKEVDREVLVEALILRVEAKEFECKQAVSGMVSFQIGNLQKRGLVKVVVEKSEAAGRTGKTTLTIKTLSRLREFDAENEPKLGVHELWVYNAIPKAGIRRPDLVTTLESAIEAGTFVTAQKPSGFISFHCGNLRKRGLIGEVTVEEARPEVAPEEAEPEVATKTKSAKKAA